MALHADEQFLAAVAAALGETIALVRRRGFHLEPAAADGDPRAADSCSRHRHVEDGDVLDLSAHGIDWDATDDSRLRWRPRRMSVRRRRSAASLSSGSICTAGAELVDIPAAHASGVFIPLKATAMTTKRMAVSAADGGTMDAHADAAPRAAARAQAELVDLLARLVLASVERDATATEQKSPSTHGKNRSKQRRA